MAGLHSLPFDSRVTALRASLSPVTRTMKVRAAFGANGIFSPDSKKSYMPSPTARLRELGLELPELPSPAGTYVHAVRSGRLLFLAGKGPGEIAGKVGRDFTVEEAYEAARRTGLTLLAAIANELGSLDRVTRVVKVVGFVNATPEFADQPKVINGCSDLFVAVFGERGRHARSAIGVASLPNGIPVEIEAIVEFDDA